jgi:Tol biopolymer transport system component/DNA-binding winged helix-turn-helix (wHTH) protein
MAGVGNRRYVVIKAELVGAPAVGRTTMISLADEPDFPLGGWTVSPSTGTLRHGDRLERVEPRVMRVLLSLAKASGQTVSRDRLMEEAWGRIVSEDAVVRCIVVLRSIFEGDPEVSVSTVRKVGYRLVAPEPQGASPEAHPRPRRLVLGLAGAFGAVALIGAGAAVIAALTHPAPPKVMEFTAEPGTKNYPDFDPSGTRVAYSQKATDTDNARIVVRPVKGGAPVPFTDGDDISPTWSPDGASIAFVRALRGQPACRLLVKPYPTGPEREFGRCGAPPPYTTIDFMADGAGVVLSDRPQIHAPYRLVRVGLDGSRRQLTRPPEGAYGDVYPKVSPDGRSIAFSRSLGLGLGDLYVLDLKSGRTRRLTREGVAILGIAWADDGRKLYFTSLRGQWGGIWSIGVSGGRPREVAPGLIHTADLAQAKGVLVTGVRSRRLNLFERPAGKPERAAPDPSVNMDWEPDVSRDGTLLFLSNRSGAIQAWTRAPGGVSRQATHLEHRLVTCPRWSPDGRTILLLAGGADGLDVATVGAAGGALKRLTRSPGYRLYPSWSADGRHVYFSGDLDGRGWRIWRMPAAGGTPAPFTEAGWRAGRESPDGRWFYASKVDAPGLWRRPTAGGPFELVLPGLGAYDGALWSLAGERLYYVARAPGREPTIMERSLGTGEERALAVAPNLLNVFYSCYGLSARSDGGLTYARLIRQESELFKVELPR